MRKLLSSLVVFMLVGCPFLTARSQTGPPAVQTQAAQSPDLAEADRLTRNVVQLFKAGKFEEALPDAERVVALREKVLGSDHIDVAKSLSNLATILSQLGKRERARDVYERTLPIFESKLGADDILTNQTREDLANIYFGQGDYKSAQGLLERALSGREKTLGADHEMVTRTLVDLAYVYIVLRYSTKREATMRRLLDIAEKKPEPTLKITSKLFADYFCTGAVAPGAPAEQKEIIEHMQKLWSVQKYGEDSAVGGEVLNGKAIRKPVPSYPVGARSEGVQGTVVVSVTVDESGKVIKAAPLCGPQALLAESVSTAKLWKFTPTLLNGVPVKVTGTISFHFNLQ